MAGRRPLRSPSVRGDRRPVRNYRANFQSWHCRKKTLLSAFRAVVSVFFVDVFSLYFSCIAPSAPRPSVPAPPGHRTSPTPPTAPDYPARERARAHNILVIHAADEPKYRTPHRSADAMVCLNFVTPRFSVKISLCPTALLSPVLLPPLKTGPPDVQ